MKSDIRRLALAGFAAASLVCVPAARAQYTADFQTNIISGITSNWSGTYYVGYSNANDVLIIQNGGVLNGDMWGGSAGVGATYNSSNNFVLVSGPGSLWSLPYGYISLSGSAGCCSGGPGNRMVISNGGVVASYHGYIGDDVFNFPGSDSVLVSDPGSAWKMQGQFVVGSGSSMNSAIISNGAVVYNYDGYMGYSSGSGFNTAVVTGTGSVWSNAAGLEIGPYGGPNILVILDGALVTANYGTIGPRTSSNLVVVSGSGSLWSNRNDVTVGGFGSGNTLVISNGGSLVASNLCIGTVGAGTYGENPVEGPVGEGTLILNGGSITVGRFLATNGSSFVTFSSGLISAWQTTVGNGPMFVVGDGIQAATFHMLGGTNSFASNLWIRANALLTGCASVYGSTLINGTLVADCGGTFTFAGTVTNTGTIVVQNSTALSFYGPVVNSGLIVATNGILQGYSTLQNNGTILGVFQDMHDVWTNSSGGKWEEASNWSRGAPTNSLWCVISNTASKVVTIDSSTTNAHSETLTIHSLTLGAPPGTTNTLSLSDAGVGTPLRIQHEMTVSSGGRLAVSNGAVEIGVLNGNSLTLDGEIALSAAILTVTNGQMRIGANGAGRTTVSNSVVLSADTSLGWGASSTGSLAVAGTNSVWNSSGTVRVGQDSAGNSLAVSDGSQVISSYGQVGYGSSSSNNVVQVAGSGSSWSNRNDLSVGSSGSGNRLVISNGGVVRASYGYIGSNVTATGNSVVVTDGGSVWSNRNSVVVGWSGTGNSLVISNGGKVISSFDKPAQSNHVGYASSNNRVIVSDSNSIWRTLAPINIGHLSGGNSMVISNGGQVADTSGAVGINAVGASNSVLVVGTGSIWSNSSRLFVGYSGAVNTLTIKDGGVVINGGDQSFAALGNNPGSSNNAVVVAGAGSTWISSGDLWVGASGFGNSLVISNGGRVVNGFGSVGGTLSSGNSALVDGAGSVWSNRNNLTIGSSGPGNSLVISNSGRVVDGDCFIGQLSSNNSVRVATAGVWQNNGLRVGNQGTGNSLIVVGGTVLATNLVVGFGSALCDNVVQLDSGSVIVTNASANGVLEVRRGKFIFNGGTLQVDRFVMTNACAQFVRTGGTLIYGSAVLATNLDADGDGIPNGWEQAYGLDPLNAADADADPDGDGFSNLQEFQAGTDPTNSASAFRILSVVPTNNDMLVTWTAGGGRTNVVQSATDLTGGYTNVSQDIILTGSGDVTTNWLDAGAATNTANRFYRIRLVP